MALIRRISWKRTFFPGQGSGLGRWMIFCLLGLLGIAGPAASQDVIEVAVSIAPQAYFAERIGGPRLKVHTLIPVGKSPATYTPTPRQLAKIARCRLYFRVGLPFERNIVPRLQSGLGMRIIDTRRGIPLMKAQGRGTEKTKKASHGSGGETDPHIWMDPLLAKKLAQNMRDGLMEIDPQGRTQYEQGFAALAADLDALDKELRRVLKPLAGRTVYVFHPAYGYFCRAYGLVQKAVESEGKEPGIKELTKLIKAARRDGVRVIFVQPQFPRKSAEAIARAIQGSVVVLDPLAKDYIANLKKVAAQISAALRKNS